jgi:hypothetical protein
VSEKVFPAGLALKMKNPRKRKLPLGGPERPTQIINVQKDGSATESTSIRRIFMPASVQLKDLYPVDSDVVRSGTFRARHELR